jgi:hypothetical protein
MAPGVVTNGMALIKHTLDNIRMVLCSTTHKESSLGKSRGPPQESALKFASIYAVSLWPLAVHALHSRVEPVACFTTMFILLCSP